VVRPKQRIQQRPDLPPTAIDYLQTQAAGRLEACLEEQRQLREQESLFRGFNIQCNKQEQDRQDSETKKFRKQLRDEWKDGVEEVELMTLHPQKA